MRRVVVTTFAASLAAWAAVDSWWRPPLPPIHAAWTTPGSVPDDPLVRWRDMDADVLADVALGEDPAAPVAVMWTVLNRRSDPAQPLEAVVWAGRAYGTVRGDRFVRSWSSPPGVRWARAPAAWARVRTRALAVLSGDAPDPTGGSTHFHRRGTWQPPWAPPREEWVDRGSHHFYKEA